MVSILIGTVLCLIFIALLLAFFTGLYKIHTEGSTAGDFIVLFAVLTIEVVLFKILFLGGFSL